jgi:hypothetical protein
VVGKQICPGYLRVQTERAGGTLSGAGEQWLEKVDLLERGAQALQIGLGLLVVLVRQRRCNDAERRQYGKGLSLSRTRVPLSSAD